jgi:hypothetical protein
MACSSQRAGIDECVLLIARTGSARLHLQFLLDQRWKDLTPPLSEGGIAVREKVSFGNLREMDLQYLRRQ